MPAQRRRPAESDPVVATIELIGDAWSWLILRDAIFDGVTRFDDFHFSLGIARSTLTSRLARLAEGGLLEHDGGGYVLTRPGADLFPSMVAAMWWGDRWCSPGAQPRAITHTGCGHTLEAAFVCSACHERLRVHEIRSPAHSLLAAGHLPRQRMPRLDLLERGGPCSIARTLQVQGDRWSVLVLRESFYGTRRFETFQRNLRIASNILSDRLSRLVEHGVLDRRPYSPHPQRFEYRLTPQGRDLGVLPLAVVGWGNRWMSGRTSLTHVRCGKRFRPMLACDRCAEEVSRDDVVLGPRRRSAVFA